MRKYLLALGVIIAALHCKAGSAVEGDARAQQFCDASCSCEGCTEADRGVCISENGDLISNAQTSHCDSELDSYFSCLEKDAFCDSGTYDTSTCHTEENVLSQCTNGGSVSSSGSGGASSSSTVASGTGGVGGGTGCIKCSGMFSGGSASSLCAPSQPIFAALVSCGCMATTCQPSCPSLCSGLTDTSTCFSCVQSLCGLEYTNCVNDF